MFGGTHLPQIDHLPRLFQIDDDDEQDPEFDYDFERDGRRLFVDALGEDVGFPLGQETAKALVTKCQLAPYGHGENTLVDTHVRNTWELSVGQFTLQNPAWDAFVTRKILPALVVPLGIRESVHVEAKLYKMLLYEVGGKFETHQDSEKEDGMFGTLVVVLPGHFEGGELVVHDPSVASSQSSTRKSYTWNAGAMDPYAVKFAAFYGDCPHEIQPVTRGYRLCLTYNLVAAAANHSTPHYELSCPSYDALQQPLGRFFTAPRAHQAKQQRVDEQGTKHANGVFDVTNPETFRQCKLVYVFTHKYTPASLSFQYLEGKDAVVAASLARFCEESCGAMALCLCEIDYAFEWHGVEGACYDSEDEDYDDGDGDNSRPELTLGLICVQCVAANRATGEPRSEKRLDMKDRWVAHLKKEVAPAGLFDDGSVPFDTDRHELYTGNEGAVIEKQYSSAALVVVPTRELEQHIRTDRQLFASPSSSPSPCPST